MKQFIIWLKVPIETACHKDLVDFIGYLLAKRLTPKTINCYLDSIRGFYDYLIHDEQIAMQNPVKPGDTLRMSKPLPRFLHDDQVRRLFAKIDDPRDLAIFTLMLRYGLRVEEVAKLTSATMYPTRSILTAHESCSEHIGRNRISKMKCHGLKTPRIIKKQLTKLNRASQK